MRACFLVLAAFLCSHIPRTLRAQARVAGRATSADVAEQLVAQVQGWFVNLGAQGKVPRVFTGITRDARQFVVEFDGLTFDHVKRRDFMIWLGQKFSLIAYAYATRVMVQKRNWRKRPR